MNIEEKKFNERSESQNQVSNDQSIKPSNSYDAGNLIGAQIKTSYQNKMDGDSFLIT